MGDSAYARWRAQPFPKSRTDDHLDELNKVLAYWDATVADTVVPVIERGAAYDSGALDLHAGLAAYRQALTAASMHVASDQSEFFAQHLRYADLLIAANTEAMDSSTQTGD